MFFVQLFFLGYEQLLKEKEQLLIENEQLLKEKEQLLIEKEQRLMKVAKSTEALKQAHGRSVPVAEGCVELVFGCVGFLFWIFS